MPSGSSALRRFRKRERRLAERSAVQSCRPRSSRKNHPQAALTPLALQPTGGAQTREQKAAINQFHIAAISEHFRGAGARKKRQRAKTCRSISGWPNYILEGSKDGLDRGSGAEAGRRRCAARDHQRPADGRDGRSRPAVQQQRADRRRSAAIGGSDEDCRRAISSNSWRRRTPKSARR